jgi:hypothetical protein
MAEVLEKPSSGIAPTSVQLSPVTPDTVPSLSPIPPTPKISEQSVINTLTTPDTSNPLDKQSTDAVQTMRNWVTNPNAENNQKVSDVIIKKNDIDKTAHINTQTQWDGVLMSLLSNDIKGAFKYYNGGPKEYEEAYSPTHGYAVKEYNLVGFTGRYFTKDKNGALTPIDPQLINDIEKKGGYFINRRDTTALQDARYKGASELAQLAMTGAPKIVLQQYQTAADVGAKAAGYANLVKNRTDIFTKRDANGKLTNSWVDAVSALKPEEFKDLYQANQQYITLNQNLSSGLRGGNAAGVQTSDTNANKIGGQFGGGFGSGQLNPNGGISPSLNANITGGISNSATNGITVNQTTGAESASSAGTTNQIQQQFRNKVESIIGSKINTPQEFQDLQRYLSLTNEINSVASTLDLENKAPGTVPVTKMYDPLLTGRKNLLLQDQQAIKNAAITAYWESFLYRKINENNGQVGSRDQLAEEFANTNTIKGINHLYDSRMNSILSGKAPTLKEGDISANPSTHRPEIYRKGQWEPLNAR